MDDGQLFCAKCGTQVNATSPTNLQPRTVVAGQVRKCPACGTPIESFQTRCSSCGHELNDIKTTESVQEFFQKLEALSNLEYDANKTREMAEERQKTQESHKITVGKVFLWLFFFWFLWIPIIFKKAKGPYATALAIFGIVAFFSLLLMVPQTPPTDQNIDTLTEQAAEESEKYVTSVRKEIPTIAKVVVLIISLVGMVVVFIIMKPKLPPEDQRRKSMIEMYPIPNSKEDLTEFAILSAGQIKKINTMSRLFNLQAKRQLWLNEIWISKFNQIYTKARIAMKDDPNSFNTINQLMAEVENKK
jgi:DNA-directed RNA polymerase subunit RPC12/RpoP